MTRTLAAALALLPLLLFAPSGFAATTELPSHGAALRLAPEGSAVRPLVRLEASRALLSLGRTDEALVFARAASAEIEAGHAFADWIEARSGVAGLLLAAGSPAEGIALLDTLEIDVVKTEDPRVILTASARFAEVWTAAGRPDRARRLIDGMLRMLSQGGDANSTASGLCMKAKLLARIGADDEAREMLRTAESVIPAIREDLKVPLSDVGVQLVEAPYVRANHLLIAADVWHDLGEAERVRAIRATVEAELATIRTHDYSDEIHAALARLEARQGDLPAALDRLAKVGDYALRAETAAGIAERILARDGATALDAWMATNETLFAGGAVHLDDLRAKIALAHARTGDRAATLAALARVAASRPLALALARLPAANECFSDPDDDTLRRDLEPILARFPEAKRPRNAPGKNSRPPARRRR